MKNLVEEIESNLLSVFRETGSKFSTQFPNVKAVAYSSPVGSATQLQGHHIVIDCLLTDAPLDQSDNVALSVNICHLTTQPKINADVCWGHPSGTIEDSFYDDWQKSEDWPLATKETVAQLYQTIPRLIAALEMALKRGCPPENYT